MALPPEVKEAITEIAKESFESFLQKLFGIKPRGDLQKFHRTIYPFAAGQAKISNRRTCVFWFGDYVAVEPNGNTFIRVKDVGTVQNLFAVIIPQLMALNEQWFDTTFPHCDPGNFEDRDKIAQCIAFVPYNVTGTDDVPGGGGGGGLGGLPNPSLAGGPLMIIGLLVLAGFVLKNKIG